MKTNVLCLLLGAAASRRLHNHEKELLSIGEMIHRHPKLLQIGVDVEKWDEDVLGLVDMDSYTGET